MKQPLSLEDKKEAIKKLGYSVTENPTEVHAKYALMYTESKNELLPDYPVKFLTEFIIKRTTSKVVVYVLAGDFNEICLDSLTKHQLTHYIKCLIRSAQLTETENNIIIEEQR